VTALNGDGMRYRFLLRKSWRNKEIHGRRLPLRSQIIFAIDRWIKAAKLI
jgi:hypothetical protein